MPLARGLTELVSYSNLLPLHIASGPFYQSNISLPLLLAVRATATVLPPHGSAFIIYPPLGSMGIPPCLSTWIPCFRPEWTARSTDLRNERRRGGSTGEWVRGLAVVCSDACENSLPYPARADARSLLNMAWSRLRLPLEASLDPSLPTLLPARLVAYAHSKSPPSSSPSDRCVSVQPIRSRV